MQKTEVNINVNAHSKDSVDTIVECHACGEITARAFKTNEVLRYFCSHQWHQYVQK